MQQPDTDAVLVALIDDMAAADEAALKALYGLTSAKLYGVALRVLGKPDSLIKYVADRYDLRRDISFKSRVKAAHYDEDANLWQVEMEDGRRAAAPLGGHAQRQCQQRQERKDESPRQPVVKLCGRLGLVAVLVHGVPQLGQCQFAYRPASLGERLSLAAVICLHLCEHIHNIILYGVTVARLVDLPYGVRVDIARGVRLSRRLTSRWRPGVSFYVNDSRVLDDRAAVAYRCARSAPSPASSRACGRCRTASAAPRPMISAARRRDTGSRRKCSAPMPRARRR